MDELKIKKDLDCIYGRARLDILAGDEEYFQYFESFYDAVQLFYDRGYLSGGLYYYAQSLRDKLSEISASAAGGELND